ncbi:hypothetical protein GGU11DRAFT_732253 [Lentinula aff. detonsa]|nr:hypothetical protein GGU11DRAFT_732253 [Lentinula aff. detonsa]
MSSSSRRPKSPTRVQLSSRLAYENKIPKFLQRLKNQVEGKIDASSYDDDDEEAPDHGGYNDDEFEYMNDGSGRPPIPRRPRSSSPRRREQRPPIPTRPDNDPGSADEDSDDEKPQVVVLKAGKHLSEREAENERRKERGLPPLPEPDKTDSTISLNNKSQSAKNKESKSLSFSSKSSSSTNKSSNNFNALKRKVLGGGVHDDEEDNDEGRDSSKKKEKRTLLSFGDDA